MERCIEKRRWQQVAKASLRRCVSPDIGCLVSGHSLKAAYGADLRCQRSDNQAHPTPLPSSPASFQLQLQLQL